MPPKKNKTALIVAIIIIVLVIAFSLWWFVIKKKDTGAPGGNEPGNGGTTQPGTGGVSEIKDPDTRVSEIALGKVRYISPRIQNGVVTDKWKMEVRFSGDHTNVSVGNNIRIQGTPGHDGTYLIKEIWGSNGDVKTAIIHNHNINGYIDLSTADAKAFLVLT